MNDGARAQPNRRKDVLSIALAKQPWLVIEETLAGVERDACSSVDGKKARPGQARPKLGLGLLWFARREYGEEGGEWCQGESMYVCV